MLSAHIESTDSSCNTVSIHYYNHPNNKLNPITWLIAGYLTLRIRSGRPKLFDCMPTLPNHPMHMIFVLT